LSHQAISIVDIAARAELSTICEWLERGRMPGRKQD
jgi:hypothetical protein